MNFDRTQILNALAASIRAKTYLEIGLGDGRNFAEVSVDHGNKVSVDPAPNLKPTFAMTSDDFFAQNRAKFDLVLIDGLHESEQVERDIENAVAALNDGGVIVCHDLNPIQEIHQSRPRQSLHWNGDCWKAWVKLRERADLEMVVIDCDQGCGIIRRGTQEPMVTNEELTWDSFVRNRMEWLNLVEEGKFREILKMWFGSVTAPVGRGSALKISPSLYSKPPRIGVVIGTFAAVPYIHLQLEARRQRYPGIPFLVHDDDSPFADEIGALCEKYAGVQFSWNALRQRHCIGDLTTFYSGLEWATGRGMDLLVKISRRFVFTENVFPRLRKLALETQYPTFSSYTSTFDFGFRTECLGMATRVWGHPEFTRDLAERIDGAQGIFVEGYLHNWARRLYERSKSPESEATDRRQNLGHDKSAYALWPDLGTDRCQRQPSHLWHDSSGPADYAALARELGLPYTADDFRDANQGHGTGESPYAAAFLHIPKTGGGYVQGCCGRLKGIGHEDLGPVAVHGHVLTCVRNPLTRVLSAYAWIMKDGPVNRIDSIQRAIIRERCGNSFARFCEHLPELVNDERMIHFVPQTRHLERLRGDHGLTVLQYESLNSQLAEFTTRHKMPFTEISDKPNASGRGPIRAYYQISGTAEKVCKAYASDFERFGFATDWEAFE